MRRTLAGLAAAALFAALPATALAQYSIKETTNAPPKEVPDPVRKLLNDRSVQLLDGKGTVLAEVWFRKEVPVKTGSEPIKGELTYREIPETTLLGVMQVPGKGFTDYRKQELRPGVYTLRFAYQLQDGNHMGTAPYAEFCLAVPILRDDKGEPTIKVEELHSLSSRSVATGGTHPCIFLLFPGEGASEQPKLVDKGEGHWAVLQKIGVSGQKGALGIALNLIGASPG